MNFKQHRCDSLILQRKILFASLCVHSRGRVNWLYKYCPEVQRKVFVCVCVCVCVLAAPKYGTSEFDVIGLDISRRGLNSVDLAFMKLCIVIQL